MISSEKPKADFTEEQKKLFKKKLDEVARELEKIENKKLLSETEITIGEVSNSLTLIKEGRRNYRLGLSITKPDIDSDPLSRLDHFDYIMNTIRDVGVEFFWGTAPDGHYRAKEFLVATPDSYFNDSSRMPLDQETVLEICELVAKKIGVELKIL